jgi:starch phosphorylase
MSLEDIDPRPLPEPLAPLAEIARDLRWCGTPDAAAIWRRLDPETWDRTRNAVLVLGHASDQSLDAVADDPAAMGLLDAWRTARAHREGRPRRGPRVAYFSMEFGLAESLPIYSGGLGVLAGDVLKAADDQDRDLTGVGLLFQHGSVRQELAEDGTQREARPYNDASSLPIRPLRDRGGRTVRIRVPLPGRDLFLRTWIARVGRTDLLLLDANDPMNGPRDRAITAELYCPDPELRLLQELVLGFGGWRLLERLGLEPEVCHLNEGHAAFAVVARAAAHARRIGGSFAVGLRAVRAGIIFTTHTPVAAAFDRYPAALVERFAGPAMREMGADPDLVLELGRPCDDPEGFETAHLLIRGAGHVNGVSRLHGRVSRRLFAPLFPRVPLCEVPIGHVTNGVDTRTWTGPAAASLWREVAPDGPLAPWRADGAAATIDLDGVPDARLWAMRSEARRTLVETVRRRMVRWAGERGAPPETVARYARVLEPDRLTLGLARRFTEYKRTTLPIHDPERLRRLLLDPDRPVQLLVAGKAHPSDGVGRAMVREMVRFAADPAVADRVVFVPDHDLSVALELAAGVDVWLNTPRRPNEACGTSGMKILANGGLHASIRDGWWDEAWDAEAGWSVGDETEHGPEHDAADAAALMDLLERDVVPAFHDRDADGLPRRWLARIRASMQQLTPRFDAARMVEDLASCLHDPAAAAWRIRRDDPAATEAIERWVVRTREALPSVRVLETRVEHVPTADADGHWRFLARIDPGRLSAEEVDVELYADPPGGRQVPVVLSMSPIDRDAGIIRCAATVPADRPWGDFTVRVRPAVPEHLLEIERPGIAWSDAPARRVEATASPAEAAAAPA